DSVQGFDRILLSIPCKSMGHFDREEAAHLLKLLQVQET
ncbi:MAG: J domain-containing protein, partial [Acaryochloridaceae cyanobacterium CSU_5_19]|nr:J domain-containing protein [Acaryochloridaceae cyanobacterium CSU_5_19]